MTDKQMSVIERKFHQFFWIGLPIIFLMICLTLVDVIFGLHLGYEKSDILIVTFIFIFGLFLRIIGLKIIRFFNP
jgi:hypothetical protein